MIMHYNVNEDRQILLTISFTRSWRLNKLENAFIKSGICLTKPDSLLSEMVVTNCCTHIWSMKTTCILKNKFYLKNYIFPSYQWNCHYCAHSILIYVYRLVQGHQWIGWNGSVILIVTYLFDAHSDNWPT